MHSIVKSLCNFHRLSKPTGRYIYKQIQRPYSSEAVVQQLFEGLCAKDRTSLARAITLVETSNAKKRKLAQNLVSMVSADLQKEQDRNKGIPSSFRIGLSGPPGAGKSTFIETLGKQLTGAGHRVAVLAVDPSSNTTGGSLLGDKTRMPRLTVDPAAYIRPSPTGGHLGGVTRVTNDTILLCERAAYDVIIVETVGVGQSEISVSEMVDVFLLLMPPAGGDELQGLKRGIVELADVIAINKSDGDLVPAARRIQAEYLSALKFVRPRLAGWRVPVLRCSARTGDGMTELWQTLTAFRERMTADGQLAARRRRQRAVWLWSQIERAVVDAFRRHPAVRSRLPRLEREVATGRLPPGVAADRLVQLFLEGSGRGGERRAEERSRTGHSGEGVPR
ncbi:methylmalonic aciduria type A homolog, mitochondrial-like [Amphibalanus amphitrite]|uniref:methylmalonic aciduria type A homolog, mitochondrial-like n=1 Tax=Amphibalanus amphitrite TaxID=1232801 RepID=UPI001C90366C|nr:methylmalonic aciduria type A homolog, mitochondrial-like [Amphibalanus amphitrite]